MNPFEDVYDNDGRRPKLYEIQFSFKNNGAPKDKPEDKFALVLGYDAASGLRSLLNVWQPNYEISNTQIREVNKYFQILLDPNVGQD